MKTDLNYDQLTDLFLSVWSRDQSADDGFNELSIVCSEEVSEQIHMILRLTWAREYSADDAMELFVELDFDA